MLSKNLPIRHPFFPCAPMTLIYYLLYLSYTLLYFYITKIPFAQCFYLCIFLIYQLIILYPQHNKEIGLQSPIFSATPFFGINFISPVLNVSLIIPSSIPSFAARTTNTGPIIPYYRLIKKYDTPSQPQAGFILDLSSDFFSSSIVTILSNEFFSKSVNLRDLII